jgi:hypothetical protein
MSKLIKVLAVYAIAATLVFAGNRQRKKTAVPAGATKQAAAPFCPLL